VLEFLKKMPNRKKGPHIITDFNLVVENVEKSILANGMPVFEINSGTQEIIKLELVFRAGRIHEKKIASAKAAINLLREGSTSKNSQEMAYLFDFYGASVRTSSGIEFSSISLVCLTKHLEIIWPSWLEMITSPAYDASEFLKYKELTSKKLSDQLSKNDIISYRIYTEKLFGSTHPYGYNTQPEQILSLAREDLLEYYATNCGLDNAFLVISGSYPQTLKALIFDSLGSADKSSNPMLPKFPNPVKERGEFKIKTQNDVQTSIKLGNVWVSRHHEDYTRLKFLNTILGGYFGSRLMKNIREEKGYTYGIYSSFDSWDKEGYFYISTDVGADFLDLTLTEIYKEIELLKSIKIEEAEIDMVKSFLLGQSLHMIDGPFATADLIKNLHSKNLDLNIYYKSIRDLKKINSKELIELANQYLNIEDFTTVLVGNI
jgi:predicted Zn-dependent peptidase